MAAWRTAALNHVRLIEDVAARGLEVRDDAPDFFECPTLHPALPPLRPDQEAALTAWDRAGRCGVIVKPTGVPMIVAVRKGLALRAGRLPAGVLPFGSGIVLKDLMARLEAFGPAPRRDRGRGRPRPARGARTRRAR